MRAACVSGTYISRTFAPIFKSEHLTSFQNLGLSIELTQALAEHGIVTPTAIQEKAIPGLLYEDRDFIGLAQTGTGKTAAFGLPLLDHIEVFENTIQSVVLAPTRELAQQIAEALKQFGKFKKGLQIQVVYGGAPINRQMADLKHARPHILVATPGRLIDLIGRKALDLSEIRYVVLDEADEMLNMGFKEDIDRILQKTPSDKRTWLFSATMPKEIREIVHHYMVAPMEVSVSQEQRVNVNISHQYVVVSRKNKVAALKRLIDMQADMYALIFCRTKIETQKLASELELGGYPAEAIHGDLSQEQRNNVMRKFKAGRVRLLVATDVAARGIDVDDLSHVVNINLPDDVAYYTHRSGRTARGGKSGVSIAILEPSELRKFNSIAHQLKINAELITIPDAKAVAQSKLKTKVESLLNTPREKIPVELLHEVMLQTENMSKEDLLIKLLSAEIKKLNIAGEENLNAEVKGGRDEAKGKFPTKVQRFNLNIGSADRIKKGDIVKIVCDASGLTNRQLGKIEIRKKQALIEVDAQGIRNFQRGLKDMRFRGRKVQVSAA